MSHRPARRAAPRIAALVAVGLLLPAPSARAATETVDAALANYLKSADEICLTARKKMAATLPQYEKHKAASTSVTGGGGNMLATPKEVQAFVAAHLPVLQDQQTRLELIPKPTKQASELSKLYADAAKAIAEIRKSPAKAPFTDPLRPVAEAARAIGFAQCYQAQRP